jgi:heptosyltransferase II
MTTPPQKILIRGVNWLGDAVMSLPAVERLREAQPQAHISVLTSEKLAELWRLQPAIHQVLTFSKSDSVFSIARRLRTEQFDVVVIFPNSPRTALETFFARIPERIGYARPWRNWLLTQALSPRPEATLIRPRSISDLKTALTSQSGAIPSYSPKSHHLFDYLHLVTRLGAKAAASAPRLVVPAMLLDEVKQLLPKETPTGGWFGLNPGAEYGPAKRWPTQNFVNAALEIHRQNGCGWILYGGPADKALADEIELSIKRNSVAPIMNLAGKTTLPQLCAALKLCRVLLTNDTGPMHLAAAVGVPVVVPFGSTSPELTGPGLPGEEGGLIKAKVACSPCFRRTCPIDFQCMQSISVEQVVSAALRVA